MYLAEDDMGDGDGVSGVHLLVWNAIVRFHGAVEIVMAHLGRQMAKSNYVTPRHYLDLINHFVKLFTEKRQEIEELQSHLNMGLRILSETEEEVKQTKKIIFFCSPFFSEKQADNFLPFAKFKD